MFIQSEFNSLQTIVKNCNVMKCIVINCIVMICNVMNCRFRSRSHGQAVTTPKKAIILLLKPWQQKFLPTSQRWWPRGHLVRFPVSARSLGAWFTRTSLRVVNWSQCLPVVSRAPSTSGRKPRPAETKRGSISWEWPPKVVKTRYFTRIFPRWSQKFQASCLSHRCWTHFRPVFRCPNYHERSSYWERGREWGLTVSRRTNL